MASARISDDEVDVVIVGAGPIGLAHAWGLKKLNPDLNVVMLEKYNTYQRTHTLRMDHNQLNALMQATDTTENEALCTLLDRIKKDPNIRTTELEKEFKRLAVNDGVDIRIETVSPETIHENVVKRFRHASLIIGADGTHSVVSDTLFSKGNRVKHEFDYVLQLRYEISGDKKAETINTITFLQQMARRGRVANEYVGHFHDGRTPVTMQMMISKAEFQAMQAATSKNPVQPFRKKDEGLVFIDEALKGFVDIIPQPLSQEGTESKRYDSAAEISAPESSAQSSSPLRFDQAPIELQTFIAEYLNKKRQAGHVLVPETIRLSVNEAPATHAKNIFREYRSVVATPDNNADKISNLSNRSSEDGRASALSHLADEQEPISAASTEQVSVDPLLDAGYVVLVGDAGLGLSYFKGLNAGLASTAQFFRLMKAAIQKKLSNKQNIKEALQTYQTWFLQTFAPAKVQEVASYSKWYIRSAMHVMKWVRSIKSSSMIEHEYAATPSLHDYFHLRAIDPTFEQYHGLYPHRPYELVQFGQFEYVPIKHTLKKIGKLFVDYVKPYKGSYQFWQDIKQPFVGFVHLLSGVTKIVVGFLTLDGWRFLDGLFSLVRGALEAVTFPLAWTLKPIMRGVISCFYGPVKIEDNKEMKKLARLGQEQLDHQITGESSHKSIYRLLAICNDMHRKFDKQKHRKQDSNAVEDEQKQFEEVRAAVNWHAKFGQVSVPEQQVAAASAASEERTGQIDTSPETLNIDANLFKENLKANLRNYFSLFARGALVQAEQASVPASGSLFEYKS